MTLSTDIAEYLRGERKPMKRQDLCTSIVIEASHNNAWPTATFGQWDDAITTAIKDGLLVMDGEKVWLAPKEAKPVSQQLDLF